PCLHGHYSGSIVGTIDKSSQDASGFFVAGEFSRVPTSKGPEVLEHAREGFPWQASIGVQGVKVLHVDKGATHKVNGQTIEGPCDVWLESTVFEVSFVPFGADDDTAAIAMSAGGKTLSPEDNTMHPKDAPDSQNLSGQPGAGTPPPAAPPATAPDTAALDAAKAEGAKLAAAEASQNAAALLTHGKTLGLSMDEIQPVMALGLSKAAATEKLLELAAGKNPPVGTGVLVMGADEADKFRLAAGHGLRMRLGQKVDKPAPGHERFRGLSLVELGRECLRRQGVNPDGMTASQVARKVIVLSAGPMGTSDFQSIAMDAINKNLLAAYAEAPSTYRTFASIISASDYKEIHGISLSEAPDLDLVLPGGEYKNGALKDKRESYRLAKFGKVLHITEEAIVNDDTGAFTRMPQLLGAAAGRKVNQLVYSLITSNPVMTETGKTLFHADHKNLASGAANLGGITSDILSYMRQMQRKQKGLNGAVLGAAPAFLLLPTKYETSADIILRSAALPEATMSAGVTNPWAGKLQPVVDACLDAADVDAWYTATAPNQIPTIEVAFLDGNQAPILTEDEEFRRDVIALKVKQVVGVGLVDFRGLQKNPGK
ncbi:MAG: hypothetical protein KKF77_03045, partial [Proteobacteria bacterium]|nr:hypothetical protein [Pseudomonadota bacterium]